MNVVCYDFARCVDEEMGDLSDDVSNAHESQEINFVRGPIHSHFEFLNDFNSSSFTEWP